MDDKLFRVGRCRAQRSIYSVVYLAEMSFHWRYSIENHEIGWREKKEERVRCVSRGVRRGALESIDRKKRGVIGSISIGI